MQSCRFTQLFTHPDKASSALWRQIDATQQFLTTRFGRVGNELALAGPQETIRFALEGLESALGSQIRQRFVKGWVSSWVANPFFRGTWSMAKPCEAYRRDAFRHPVGDRLMFAGEACNEFMYSTCHGAYLSGKEIALKVVDQLGQ